ncbi:AAA family ATPase [Paramicrobacterium humi]|uniref:AAA family ATPase n=1 Tax=Paramicrobacterium humi TaxID=640635 RepID=UPI001C40B361|nr:ATP-binding protein [Microbacterium humi]
MSELGGLDVLGTLSLIHRRLDGAISRNGELAWTWRDPFDRPDTRIGSAWLLVFCRSGGAMGKGTERGSHMLDKVRVQRFKSVVDAELTLGNVTVLVGPNNAGKSSLLQAIQFAVSVAQSLELTGARGWIRAEGTRPGSLATQQLIYTPLRDVDALAHGGALRTNSNEISVTFETDDLGSAEVTVKKGKNKNIQVNISGQTLGARLERLTEPFSVVAPGLAGIPAVEAFQSSGVVQRAAARGDANSVFRNVLLQLSKNPTAWGNFERSLAEIFPDVKIEVAFDDASDEYISAWATREHGPRLPIESSGTGVLQAIQVLAYVGLYEPRLLILDEPDAHLHPDNQRKLARLLVSLAAERTFQVLISTHSRHMLDELGQHNSIVQWMSAGEFRDGDFDRVAALLELGALDAGDRLRNGDTSTVLITEDSDTEYLRALALSSGLAEGEFDIWSYSGSSQTQAAATLARFIAEHAPGTRVVIHRDRDYLDDDQVADFEAAVLAAGAAPFVTVGTDVESHFLAPEHLGLVFSELTPENIADMLQRATEVTKQHSLETMITQRNAVDSRRRSREGKPPNPGAVATACNKAFDDDPERHRHGKKTLGEFRRLAQEEFKINNRSVAIPSESLRVQVLEPPAE